MNTIEGTIIDAQGVLDDEEMNIILRIEVNLIDIWGQCMLQFSPENSIKIIQILNAGKPWYKEKTINGLVDQKIKLLEHPKGGTWAPIAISHRMSNEWFFKKGFDKKCDGNPNEDREDYYVSGRL